MGPTAAFRRLFFQMAGERALKRWAARECECPHRTERLCLPCACREFLGRPSDA